MKYEVTVGENTYTVEIDEQGDVMLNGEPVEVDFGGLGQSGLYSLIVNNESFEGLVESKEGLWQVLMRGVLYEVQVADERTLLLRDRSATLVPDTGEVAIKAPMPGLVVAIPVKVGDVVEAGDNLIILESMKMQNELKVPRDGVVQEIAVEPGQSVEQNKVLVTIV
jgi:biotin carboxyl carrier protein